MRFALPAIGFGLAALLAAGTAAAEIRVTFVEPRGFTDASLHAGRSVDQDAPALAELRRILERAGQRLPPGQDLRIEVLDVDLAGWFPPGQLASGTRVLEPTTWPRIRLRYALTQQGRVLASGEETLTDRTYLQRPDAARSTAPLRFEEPMLLDWLAERFGITRRLALH